MGKLSKEQKDELIDAELLDKYEIDDYHHLKSKREEVININKSKR